MSNFSGIPDFSKLLYGLFWACCAMLPFALWKLIEIAWQVAQWLHEHVSISFTP